MPKQLKVDFMAIGAHADDVELMAGGTILKLLSLGKNGVIIDLTNASAGTRGTPELRLKEAAAAAKVLGVKYRENLGLPDSKLENNWSSQKLVIEIIRKYQPEVILSHHWKDEHPDHINAAKLVKEAKYKAGLKNIDCGGTPFRPGRLFHFMGPEYFDPTFCVDISDNWKKKLKSILCYKSQFYNPKSKNFKGKTDISSPDFLEYLEVRARFFGWRIKKRYAEPFYCTELPEVADITSLGARRF